MDEENFQNKERENNSHENKNNNFNEHKSNEINHESHHEQKKSEKQGPNFTDKMRENPWMVSTIVLVLGLLVVIMLVFNGNGNVTGTGNTISSDEAGEKLLGLYQERVDGVELESVEELSGVYQINFEYEGQVIPVYMTKDGELAGSLSPLTPLSDDSDSGSDTPTNQEIPKTDTPKAELFVMTHCPYGTQAEKGFIPMVEEFGENIEYDIKFVYYFMHDPEEEETPRQVCIREEQSEKYLDYLKCFLEGDGNADASGYMATGNDPDYCMEQAGIDKSVVEDCITSGRADDYYAADSELSESYGVRGSPTLVVNGQIVQSGRTSAAYLDTICQAFTDENVPEECGTLELSSATPNPGFGWETTSTGSRGAQCG